MSDLILPPAARFWFTVFAFALGSCAGSFINCMQIRLKDGRLSVFGRSECMFCGHRLSAADLIPILSWIFLRGKCRYCKKPIPPRYIISEISLGAVWAGLFLRFGVSWAVLEYMLLFSLLAAETLCDFSDSEVPDALHVACCALFLIFAAAHEDPLSRLLHGALNALLFGSGLLLLSLAADRISKKETLGGADIKLFAVLGLYFPIADMLLLLILSSLFGLCTAAALRRGMKKEFPFIPAIALAAFVTALFADRITGFYLGLFGLR